MGEPHGGSDHNDGDSKFAIQSGITVSSRENPRGGPDISTSPADLAVRRYRSADETAVLDLLSASLGWVPNEQYADFFRWKHQENPFGASPAWVALDAERVVGFRIFLRWEFLRDGELVRAVRAVDTATHPEYQGRGIFRLLTMTAVEELTAEGVAFVFNTPNSSSRPGYLKMGWQLVGSPPVRFLPRSLASATRLVSARVAAEKWSRSSDAGRAADETLQQAPQPTPAPGGLATHRIQGFYEWRYGFAPLAYRMSTGDEGPAGGAVVYRIRGRGEALEAAFTDVVVHPGDSRTARRLVRRSLRASGADYGLRLGSDRAPLRWLPLPGGGPTLVWRALAETSMVPLERWNLTLGDIELF